MDYNVWKDEKVADLFINKVRGSIPMAAEQISVMRRVIRGLAPDFNTVMDLGCGDGILGHAVLEMNPKAKATFIDFSEPLLKMAMKRLIDSGYKVDFVKLDYGLKDWTLALPPKITFDVIVSGFSIHHQPDARKKEIYSEIFGLLNPGGLFLNLEHVLPGSEKLTEISDDMFIEKIYEQETKTGGNKSRERLAAEYMQRPDKDANILAPIESQCQWLREIGYLNVDCYFKIFELGLFGGQKPKR
jgi:tRNA (cmo5U34)-methyltransferase